MPKLNQVIAVEKEVKPRVNSAVTELYKTVQKPNLFNGQVRKFRKTNDEDPERPDERQRVQQTVRDVLRRLANHASELMDIEARRDYTNQVAFADVALEDGTVILRDAPVTYLLFLEKQLTDMRTIVAALPTLDDAETWTTDTNSGLEVSATVETVSTKKVQRPLVLYPATPEHAAQTQIVTEDVISGYWGTQKQSGAIAATKRAELVGRVEQLIRAVKTARETANMTEVGPVPKVGDAVFGFLFGKEV